MYYLVFDITTRQIVSPPAEYDNVQVTVPATRKVIAVSTIEELINQMKLQEVIPEFDFAAIIPPELKAALLPYFELEQLDGEPEPRAIDYI